MCSKTKEEQSDRRHHLGGLLQPVGKEGVSVEYGGSDMMDRVTMVVQVERLGMLEVEDEVGRGYRGTQLITIAKNLTSSPFLAHPGGCTVW